MDKLKSVKFYFFIFSLIFLITIYSLRAIPTAKRVAESISTGIINIELIVKHFLQLFLGIIGVLSLILLPLRIRISKVFTSFSLILNILLTIQIIGNEIIAFVKSIRNNEIIFEASISFIIFGAVFYIILLLINGSLLYKNISSETSKQVYCKY